MPFWHKRGDIGTITSRADDYKAVDGDHQTEAGVVGLQEKMEQQKIMLMSLLNNLIGLFNTCIHTISQLLLFL